MNFDARFQNIVEKQEKLKAELDNVVAAYNEARSFTQSFLNCCTKHEISTVAINVRTKKIEESVSFPFDPCGSVFANGNNEHGFPKIWGVVSELNISGGCGNSAQHQIDCAASARLIDGVYELQDGVWHRLEEE